LVSPRAGREHLIARKDRRRIGVVAGDNSTKMHSASGDVCDAQREVDGRCVAISFSRYLRRYWSTPTEFARRCGLQAASTIPKEPGSSYF